VTIDGWHAMSGRHQEVLRMNINCAHLKEVKTSRANSRGCEECLRLGDSWVHLRLCRTCGHVGCCDSSKNKHATGHYHARGHPIVTSLEPGETWSWCYADQMMMELS
jgi:uncharacterized UBP type Zn finger protein